MAGELITVAVSSPHSLTVLDVKTGTYLGSIYVSDGNIIGQPIVSGDVILVTYQQGGVTYINKYSATTKCYISRQRVSP